MRTKIYILTKQCLLGTMIIIEKYTLSRGDGIERACALSERMQVTRFGRNTVLNMADALKQRPVQICKALVHQRHEQKHECEGFYKFVSEKSEQAKGRKTEPVDLVRLSVLRNDV